MDEPRAEPPPDGVGGPTPRAPGPLAPPGDPYALHPPADPYAPSADPWAPPADPYAPPAGPYAAPAGPDGPPPYATGGPAGPPRRPRRRVPLSWVTLVVALLVLAADVAVLADRRGRDGATLPVSVAAERGLLPGAAGGADQRAKERDQAIEALFERRAAAVRDRDLDAFVRDLDPEQDAFVARQREVFASLGKLDFSRWTYEPNGESYSPGNIDFGRYGAIEDVWLPVVILRYQLKGFDVDEVGRRVVYTVVRRDGTWYIGGDTDLEESTSSGTSVRVDPWENGPIVVERGPHGIVIGHPDDAGAISRIRREVEDAVRHVTSFVGRQQWNRKVVVVLPSDEEELNQLLEHPTKIFEFAAVARYLTTTPRSGQDEALAGTRVVINPDGFDAKSDTTRILIRHEITHVAMVNRIGPQSPKWLIEGVAEYVGNAGADVPPEVLAADLASEVEQNGVPDVLPRDSDFGVINDAGIGYNGAWLLCRYIASRWGRAKLLEFHDAMGRSRARDFRRPGEKLPRTLRAVLGVSEAQLLRGWQRYVRATIGELTDLLIEPGAGYRETDSGRLSVSDLADRKDLTLANLTAAGVERIAAGVWNDGPEKAPRRRFLTMLVVSGEEHGAKRAEALLAGRLRPFDAGVPVPDGRVFFVGTDIGGRHYNEAVAVLRAGTVVVELRVAVPGTGDPTGEVRRLAAAQLAKVS